MTNQLTTRSNRAEMSTCCSDSTCSKDIKPASISKRTRSSFKAARSGFCLSTSFQSISRTRHCSKGWSHCSVFYEKKADEALTDRSRLLSQHHRQPRVLNRHPSQAKDSLWARHLQVKRLLLRTRRLLLQPTRHPDTQKAQSSRSLV